jgi:ABC-type multidrug transport system fused ATPase/permease subunit
MSYTINKLLKTMFRQQPIRFSLLIILAFIIASYHFVLPWQIYSLIKSSTPALQLNHSILTVVGFFWLTEIAFMLQSWLLTQLKTKLRRQTTLLLLRRCRQGQGLPSQPSPSTIMHLPDAATELIIWIICHGLTSLLQWCYALILLSNVSIIFPIFYGVLIVFISAQKHQHSIQQQAQWQAHQTLHKQVLTLQNHWIAEWPNWPIITPRLQPWQPFRLLTKKLNNTASALSYHHLKSQSLLTLTALFSHLICCSTLLYLYSLALLSVSELSFSLMICCQLNQSFHFQAEQMNQIKRSWKSLSTSLSKIPKPLGPYLTISPTNPLPLRLDKVCFHINKTPILNNINLTLRPQSWLQISGSSGSGKTTLALLISGALQPSHGQIYFNNQPRPPQRSCHPKIFYCPTVPILSKTSLSQYLLEHNINLKNYDQDLKTLSKNTHLSAFSLGQRQRLNLITAFSGQYDIIILDEALSGVSVDMELKWLIKLKTLKSSIVYVSHRKLNSFLKFDQIIKLNSYSDE